MPTSHSSHRHLNESIYAGPMTCSSVIKDTTYHSWKIMRVVRQICCLWW